MRLQRPSPALQLKLVYIVIAIALIHAVIIMLAIGKSNSNVNVHASQLFKPREKRYLMLKDVAGRFGNALLQFKNAAIMARTLNRVLVSSIDFQTSQDVNIFDVFDIDALRNAGFMIEKSLPEFKKDPIKINVEEGMMMIDVSEEFGSLTDEAVYIESVQAHMSCSETDFEQEFYAALRPTIEYMNAADEIVQKIKEKSSNILPFVGVHLRDFEGDCINRAERLLVPKSIPSASKMCSIDYPLVSEILKSRGIEIEKSLIYVSSDEQRQDLLDTFRSHSSNAILSNLFPENRLFKPAIDMLVLAQTDLYIGNALSTFSTHVGNMRASGGQIYSGANILSWPPLEQDSSIESYWECRHSHYWCDISGGMPIC